MWRWLAENPMYDKYQYFLSLYSENIPQNECYCCEDVDFRNHEGFSACKKCKLLSLWGKADKGKTPCESKNSPYEKYRLAKKVNDTHLVVKYATIIADYCQQELWKIERK